MLSNRPVAIPALIRQRRYWLVLLVLWALAVAVALRMHVAHLGEQSIQVAAEGARNVFRMVMLTRSWNEKHGGVFLTTPPGTPGNDGKQPDFALINPAHMTRLISELAAGDAGAVFHMTSLNPLRPGNDADAWEKASLLAFGTGVKEIISVMPGPDGDLLRYMAPLQMQASCMPCHAHQGYQVGDIRGGISVTQHYAPIAAPTELSIRQSTLVYGAVFVLVTLAAWLLLELLRRRWIDLLGKIEELNTTRGELVQSEKMASLGRMVAGFAHEINTPVGVAVGAISQHEETLARINALLTQDDVDEARLRDELEQLRLGGALALSNLQRAARLVQSFKRTSIDQSFDDLHDFSVKELINDVLFSLHNVLKRLPIAVAVDCPELPRLHGLPGVLDQILTNLVMNAVLHAFDGGRRPGRIHITAQAQDKLLHLTFADDGVGMPQASVARIFEPFFTTRRADGGSGLGLYICYNLVATRLGGSIKCTSAPEAGCRFELLFPMQLPPRPQKDAT